MAVSHCIDEKTGGPSHFEARLCVSVLITRCAIVAGVKIYMCGRRCYGHHATHALRVNVLLRFARYSRTGCCLSFYALFQKMVFPHCVHEKVVFVSHFDVRFCACVLIATSAFITVVCKAACGRFYGTATLETIPQICCVCVCVCQCAIVNPLCVLIR